MLISFVYVIASGTPGAAAMPKARSSMTGGIAGMTVQTVRTFAIGTEIHIVAKDELSCPLISDSLFLQVED
jgi:hypothetical protein